MTHLQDEPLVPVVVQVDEGCGGEASKCPTEDFHVAGVLPEDMRKELPRGLGGVHLPIQIKCGRLCPFNDVMIPSVYRRQRNIVCRDRTLHY